MLAVLYLACAVEGRLRPTYSMNIDTTYENWMGESISKIGDKSLKQLTLPGSHDSGAYNLTNEIMADAEPANLETLLWVSEKLEISASNVIRNWAVSQKWSIYDQLVGGIRYLDLRAGWDNSTHTWRAYHLLMGNLIEDLLIEVRDFLDSHNKEIVILEISHFEGFPTDRDIIELQQMITSIFRGILIPTSSSIYTTINALISQNTRLLIAIEEIPINTTEIWSLDILYNTYANTPDLREMIAYNDGAVNTYMSGKHASELYKISWTLTPNSTTILSSILPWEPYTLLQLASSANKEFLKYWETQKRRGNKLGDIVMFDRFELGWSMPVFYDINRIF
jgi:hypothetical protein